MNPIIFPPSKAVEYTDSIPAKRYIPTPNECPRNDIKQSEGEAPVILELWGMRSTLLFPLLPDFL